MSLSIDWTLRCKSQVIPRVLAFAAAALLALPIGALAAGPVKAKPGKPGAFVHFDKLDADSAKKAKDGAASEATTVIVEVQSGQNLPAAFKKDERKGSLS